MEVVPSLDGLALRALGFLFGTSVDPQLDNGQVTIRTGGRSQLQHC